ncbi:MAG: hypothetical protein OHK0052_05730 [Anaerolineales bacterium]
MKSSTRTLTKVFGAALTWRGWLSLPVAQILVWAGLATAKRRAHPHKRWREILGVSGLQTALMFGSEWLHNLAHAAAAGWVGKPADEVRIMLGIPRLIYNDINDAAVTPQQHLVRAVGGPVLNGVLTGGLWLVRKQTARQPQSTAHALIDSTFKTNLFLASAAWLPVPGLDGGAALKWLLVARGHSLPQADTVVQRVNLFAAPLTAIAGGRLLQTRRTLPGVFALCMGAAMFAVGMGWLSEQSVIEKIDR